VTSLRVAEVHDLDPATLADADRPEEVPGYAPLAGARPVPSTAPMAVPEVDIATFATARADGSPVFDVREPKEYAEARVPDAVLVPLGTVPTALNRFPRDRTVYVICRSGPRSRKACEFLRGQGIDAVNVAGGTLAWIDAGHPVDQGPTG
jgi:rhodanese-related sulfurtransferase